MVWILDADPTNIPVDESKVLRYWDPSVSNELEALTEEFLRNGGQITQLAIGERAEEALKTRRQVMAEGYAMRMEQQGLRAQQVADATLAEVRARQRRDEQRYQRQKERDREKAAKRAAARQDDGALLVKVRMALNKGLRGYRNVSAETGISIRILERLVRQYNVGIRCYEHSQEA